jgi:predicted nucleic acid-binding Zn ribbon protein
MSGVRGGSPERIGTLVESLLRARGLAEGVARAAAMPNWAEIVGPQIARVATPVRFDRTTLLVEVTSSAWLMELRMMERRILGLLNRGRERALFEKIVFRLAAGG